jgi:hypothetical protein
VGKFVPLDDLKQSMPWIRMSGKQRELVQKYISNGYDKVAAVKSLYKCSTEGSVRTTINRQFSNADVRALLALHFNESALDTLKAELQRALHCRRLSQSRVRTLKLLAQAAGLDSEGIAAEEVKPAAGAKQTQCKVGDIILVDGKKVRVTVVDMNGMPTEGDPL